MNEDFDENAGYSAPRNGGHYSSRPKNGGATTANGNSRARQKTFDFWTAAEILARRWHWLVVCGILAAGAFFTVGWLYLQPNFTAVAELLRYETPGTSDFLKTTPLTSQTFAELLAAPELMRRVAPNAKPPLAPDELARRVKIDPQDESDIVKVYLSASTPQEAVQLANLYSSEATNYTTQLQATQAAEVADTYLKEQVKQMDDDITALTAQFRGVPEAAKLANTTNALNALSQSPALSSQSTYMIEKLNEQLTTATMELNQLKVKYTDQHPAVIADQQKVKTLRDELAQATGSKNPSEAVAVITASGSVVQPDLEVIRARLRSLEDARVTLDSREHEAQLYASNPPGMVRLFSPAQLKTVHSGHRRLKIGAVTLFGGALGVVFGLLLILLLEITDRRLRTVDDLQRVTSLPVLTTLGELGQMKEHARTQWAFRTWTLLQGRLSRSQNHGLVCGVTSSSEGEGRSTCISMLAEAASLAGFRVLTIATRPSNSNFESGHEFDEETLNHHSEMNANEKPKGRPMPNGTPSETPSDNPNGPLTSSVLTTPSEVTDKLTDPNARPVVHIPLPGWVWNLERRKQWRDALSHWRQIENLVIFVELPPASVPEAVLLGANLPNLLWLTGSGKADAAETRTQLETLRNAHCNLIGAILNREPSRPFKSYFPRWLTCLTLLLALGISVARAQTPPPASPTHPVPPDANPQPTATDTNTTLLTEPPPAAMPPDTDEHYSFSVVSPEQRAEWEKNLTLGPGDILSFALYGEPTLNRAEVVIGPDGRVSFLEAQDVLASGLTVDGLRQKMDDALGKYRRGPRTMITPVAYNSKKYYVLGKVVQRGVYTLNRPTTVLEALARAKGIENGQVDYDIVDVADLQRAFLMRANKRIPIDFEKLFASGDLSQNVQIEPGDYLYFPSADVKQVYVLGEVSLPGAVTYRPNLSMLAAISSRGGFDDKAYKSHVLVVRGSLNHPQTFVCGLGTTADSMHDFKLEPNDIIYVTWRPFVRGEELLDLAATAFVQAAVNGWVGADIVKP
ncbi:MAG TPA: polysaccharide biosynthesis/export family protein [Verrucomicrobiae bacterium]|jgi:protein involved in polysaccharide export with SLBB domain/capsular polysaccharide biosynthesis protein